MRLSALVELVIDAYLVVLFARVLMSWVRPRRGTFVGDRVAPLLYRLTEPLLRPVQRALSPYQGRSGVDFSPMVLGFILLIVQALAKRMLEAAGL